MDPNSPHAGNDSPPPRTTILGQLLRGRPRGTSQSHIAIDPARELSPSPPAFPPPSPTSATRARRPTAAPVLQTSASHTAPSTSGLGLSHMLRRRRSAGAISQAPSPVAPTPAATAASAPRPPPPIRAPTAPAPATAGPSHRIRLVPHLDSRRALRFEAICRDLKEGDAPLRIGRFTDRSGMGLAAVNALGSNKVAFKSKVVSRAHAEVWVEPGGKFFIRDTKSSSGTFLNHVRLSVAGADSRPHQIKDGDVLQLGVDYQGGNEDIYKSVKIRIEVGREWQAVANAFNTNALKNLKALAIAPAADVAKPKSNIPDCCICLFGVTIRQALFIAPCSHTFHYKCIRPILESHHPAFSCPLCRTFADLEEDVEVDAISDGASVAEDDAALDAPTPVVPVRDQRDPGAETEVEGEPAAPGAAGARARRRADAALDDLAELEPGDELERADEDMVDGDLRGGLRTALSSPDPMAGGSGGEGIPAFAAGRPNSFGAPAEAMDVDDGDGELGTTPEGEGEGDVDGTVGGKRKRQGGHAGL